MPASIEIAVPPPEQPNSAALGQAVINGMQQFSNIVVTAVSSLPRQTFPANIAPRLSGTPIAIPVPPPERRPSSAPGAPLASSHNAQILPVPNAEIPLGNTGGVDRISVAQANSTAALAQRVNLQYRVIVPATDPATQTQVQAIVPDAFSMVLNGRSVMQIGAFSNEENAQEAVAMLSRNGFQGIIQPMN